MRVRVLGARTTWVMIAAGALVLSGCSGPTAGWRHQGAKVVEVEATLERLTASYKSAIGDSDVPTTVPKDARCYFQVNEDKDVKDEAVCGPIRQLGSDKNLWVSTPLEARGTAKPDEIVLVAPSDPRFGETTFDANYKLLDAQGKEADRDQEVKAPAAPKAAVGDTPSVEPEDSTLDEPLVISTPDATYSFSALGISDHVGEGATRVDAPKGGAFVTAQYDRSKSGDAPNGFTSEAVLTVDGKPVEIPEGSSTVAVATAGKDAAVSIEYDGNTQVVSLAEQKLTSGHPYIDQEYEPVNKPQSVLIGDESNGASTTYTYQVDARVTSWDATNHWAPEGKDRLALAISFDESSQYKESGNIWTLRYTDTTYTVTGVTVTVDGQAIPVDPASLAVVPRPDNDYQSQDNIVQIATEIPAGAKDIKVTASVARSGGYVKDSGNAYPAESLKNEPGSIDQTLDLAEVTLTPTESGWGG